MTIGRERRPSIRRDGLDDSQRVQAVGVDDRRQPGRGDQPIGAPPTVGRLGRRRPSPGPIDQGPAACGGLGSPAAQSSGRQRPRPRLRPAASPPSGGAGHAEADVAGAGPHGRPADQVQGRRSSPASRRRPRPRSATCGRCGAGGGSRRDDVAVLDQPGWWPARRPGAEPDVGHLDPAGALGPVAEQRARACRPAKVTVAAARHGLAPSAAGVAVQAGGDVDGEHRGAGRVGRLIGAAETGAEGRVDDQVGGGQPAAGPTARRDDGDPDAPGRRGGRRRRDRRRRCCPCRRRRRPGDRRSRRADQGGPGHGPPGPADQDLDRLGGAAGRPLSSARR